MGYHTNGRVEIGVGKVTTVAKYFHLPSPRPSEDSAGEMYYMTYEDVKKWQLQYQEMYAGCHDNEAELFSLNDIEFMQHAQVLIAIARTYYSETQGLIWERELEGAQLRKFMSKRRKQFRIVFG